MGTIKPLCKKCNESYPQQRKDMGYTVCVKCSTEKGWSCSALTFHKTGNSIEIIKDPEVAYNINQMASRKSFGVMSGITGRYRKYNPNQDTEPKKGKFIDQTGLVYDNKKQSLGTLQGQTIDFENQGQQAFSILEREGFEQSISWIKNEYKQLRLSPDDFVKLIGMIKAIGNNIPESSYNK